MQNHAAKQHKDSFLQQIVHCWEVIKSGASPDIFTFATDAFRNVCEITIIQAKAERNRDEEISKRCNEVLCVYHIAFNKGTDYKKYQDANDAFAILMKELYAYAIADDASKPTEGAASASIKVMSATDMLDVRVLKATKEDDSKGVKIIKGVADASVKKSDKFCKYGRGCGHLLTGSCNSPHREADKKIASRAKAAKKKVCSFQEECNKRGNLEHEEAFYHEMPSSSKGE